MRLYTAAACSRCCCRAVPLHRRRPSLKPQNRHRQVLSQRLRLSGTGCFAASSGRQAPYRQSYARLRKSLTVQGRQGTIAQVAFGRLLEGDTLKVTVLEPRASAFRRLSGSGRSKEMTRRYNSNGGAACRGGCAADRDTDAASAARIATLNGNARLEYLDAAGSRSSFLSRRVVSRAALEALAKEAKLRQFSRCGTA